MLKYSISATLITFLLPLVYGSSLAAQEAETAKLTNALVTTSPSLSGSVWQMALGLLFVLAVIFLLTWLMRRVSGIQGSRQHIKILSAINVGTRERAVLIEVAGEQLLLGVAAGQVNLLHKLKDPVTDDGADFSSSLQLAAARLLKKTTANSHK